MNWIKLSEEQPKKYQEVIICTDQKHIKSAIYIGDGKFSTFTNVVAWSVPEPPNWLEDPEVEVTEPIKKKRGRPKKNG